jgi:hypothetical protein
VPYPIKAGNCIVDKYELGGWRYLILPSVVVPFFAACITRNSAFGIGSLLPYLVRG